MKSATLPLRYITGQFREDMRLLTLTISVCSRIICELNFINMVSYNTELTSDEWSRKRIEILKRDSFRCTHCGRSRAEEVKSSDGKIIGYFGTERECLKASNIKEIRLCSEEEFKLRHGITKFEVCSLKYEPYRFLVSNSDGKIILSAVQKHMNPLDSSLEIAEVIMKDGQRHYVEKLRSSSLRKMKADIHFIYRSEYPTSLNVHHKLYRQDRNAWDYNSKELTTLCEECHEFLHSTTEVRKIPLTPCSRCGGHGFIPRFKHIENGICFRCGGAKYDEYIDRKKHFSHSSETIRNSSCRMAL